MPHVDRMKLLREHFAKQPEEAINMGEWWCGTAGCIAGHACDIPAFKSLGMYRKDSGVPFLDLDTVGDEALAEVLGIDREEGYNLCRASSDSFGECYCTQAEALARLDALIAKYEQPTA